MAAAALAFAPSAAGALFFLFDPAAAQTGALVTVRLGGTPPGFTLAQRKRPFQPPIRLYLVRQEAASKVRTRFDRRLHFVREVVPDRHGHGLARFRLPPLDSGTYVPAAWCPACARHGFGRTFSVLTLDAVLPRYRDRMKLDVTLRNASERCPVTRPNMRVGGFTMYGNGFLSTRVFVDGGFVVYPDEHGRLSQKIGWLPWRRLRGHLVVHGERLDAPAPPLEVLGTFWGSNSAGRGGWASPVIFPSEGCWRITGRVRDIELSYVVRVVGV